MILQSLTEIKAQLPKNYKEDYRVSLLQNAKNTYGKNVIQLKPSMIPELIGKKFYVLEGQNWSSLPENSSKADRMKHISKYAMLGFDETDPPTDGYPSINVKILAGPHSTYARDDEYGAYYQKSKGTYCTGGGADPIYLFAKSSSRRKSRRSSSSRRKSRKRTSRSKRRGTLRKKTRVSRFQ